MIHFFGNEANKVFAVQSKNLLAINDIPKLNWLFGDVNKIENEIDGCFVGPHASIPSPWSTNAVEIAQNMGISSIVRIEEFTRLDRGHPEFDKMLYQKYERLDQKIFIVNRTPDSILEISDIEEYNLAEGLALNAEEIDYLNSLSIKLNRKLTDSEIFGFSQVNSEHCRHKIFNGIFEINGERKPSSLFSLIKKTSSENPNEIISAYKDNVAFINGPTIQQFAPKNADKPDFYEITRFDSVISLKAETHNFPTTVEPFNGAATGTGGEIRDRLAGGQGSIPLAGTAVYMTSYSRLEDNRAWENGMNERKWLYQSPMDILIKASNGSADFNNKFGQPLITGSVLTFEHEENGRKLGFDKVIMLAGGIGFGKKSQVKKLKPQVGSKIVVLGGDNYRIGMGGAAVSSVETGALGSSIELNAIQRSNPEMQKRVANAIRGLVESENNPVVSVHDHGAGGHLNCLSELVEESGGEINLDKLPVGDPTLSAKEIIGNESQERMGIVISQNDIETLRRIADRERTPIYEVGSVTGDQKFKFESSGTGAKPFDFALEDLFGSTPQTIISDKSIEISYSNSEYSKDKIHDYLKQVLQLEAVACKDWITNKVDRCVGGKVAKQQTAGEIQLPLNNVGVVSLDYTGKEGVATAIGHSPIASLIDPVAGSRTAIAESLSNIIWAPLKYGLKSVSLSANWMWASKNEGEAARLYEAVDACSNFAIELGINIPTGKDSLSMKQNYPDAEVISPGTVIISAAGQCCDVTKVIEPVLRKNGGNIYHINLSCDKFKLGGSSFLQVLNAVGNEVPTIKDAASFKNSFNVIQELIKAGKITSGHDIGSGGLITTLLEMSFPSVNMGAEYDLTELRESDTVKVLFAENISIVIQADDSVEVDLAKNNIAFTKIGKPKEGSVITLKNGDDYFHFDITEARDTWFKTSYLLDREQSGTVKAKERFNNYKNQPLKFKFPTHFEGKKVSIDKLKSKPKAAIIREKGSNSEREMANALYLAGFEVKDVHMTDLIAGRETLEDIQFIGAVGGFSNSDVLGSAKGWAGAFLYNEKAKAALHNFFKREDTLSVGICNGCQLFVELGIIHPDHEKKPKMFHNDSKKHECGFTSVIVPDNNSVMLSTLAGSKLGVWISHGEGKFSLPYSEDHYNIVAKYSYKDYPANPNGSDFDIAMMASKNGRHLIAMPHIERSIFQWNWPAYPEGRTDEVSPWYEAFVNARKWIEKYNVENGEKSI